MRDITHSEAKLRLERVGYRVQVDLTHDRLHAFIRGVCLVSMRIKNSCVPFNKIWQAEQGADLLRKNGRLYS